MRFVLDIDPPRTTAQQKRIAGRRPDGRPYFYDGNRLSKARGALQAALHEHVPDEPMQGCLALTVHWVFSTPDKKKWDTWKTTRPDTDNLQKMLKDEMTRMGFWKDDAQVCVEYVDKSWGERGRILIDVLRIEVKRNAFVRLRAFLLRLRNRFAYSDEDEAKLHDWLRDEESRWCRDGQDTY